MDGKLVNYYINTDLHFQHIVFVQEGCYDGIFTGIYILSFSEILFFTKMCLCIGQYQLRMLSIRSQK